LRTDLRGDPTFLELLQREREAAFGAYAHQEVPFEKVVEALRPEREMNRSPLFQVMFVLQNAPQEVLKLQELRLERMALERRTAKFDLSMDLTEREPGLAGCVEFSTGLFERATI